MTQGGTPPEGTRTLSLGDGEVGQSLSLILLTAASMVVYLGLGLLAARLLG